VLLEGVERELKELRDVDPRAMSDEELSEFLVGSHRARAQMEANEARVAQEWNARRVWAASGAKSAAACLARATRAPKQACGSLLWLGRITSEMPVVAEAWAAGDIDAAHVRKLGSALNERTREVFARDEPQLVQFATTLTFFEFGRAVDYWLVHADPDGSDESAQERHARRRVSLDETIHGMWSGSVFLDPISGAIVGDELARLEHGLFEADWAEARERLGWDPQWFELRRTPDQRRADALVVMATRSAARPANARPPKPLFTVLLGAESFGRVCQLANGQVIPPSTLGEWWSDALVERVLFDGTPDRVIGVSRKRTFQGALRRLIEVRDQFCFHPTCDEPAPRCQCDHIVAYTDGGLTSQDNGRLACGFHNRARNRQPPPDEDDDPDEYYNDDN
jgi:hypothetical protein